MNTSYTRNLVILNGAVPLAVLGWDAIRGQLGANAVNNALHITGIVSLVFLLLSLLVTPLRYITGWTFWIAYRRSLGIYGFLYALVHLLIYFAWDRMGSITSTFQEIASRRFLTIGFIAFVLMVPLAVTSTNGMIRRIGATRWKLLHRLAYLVAILGVLHYYMLVKSDVRQPLAFATALTPLLGFRLVKHYVDLKSQARQSTMRASTTTTKRPSFFQGELVVSNIKQETHDVKTFRFTNPQGGEIPFVHKPGQYMTLSFNIDNKTVKRSYTIASSPTQRGYVELTIKRHPVGTVSNFLHSQIEEGQLIKVAAPAGKFWFNGSGGSDVLLISGGVGITPIMSMLRYLTDSCWRGKIYCLNAVRTEQDVIFDQEIEDILARHANVKFTNLFSRVTSENKFEGKNGSQPSLPRRIAGMRAGYIDVSALTDLVPEVKQMPVYLCGPELMMDAVRSALQEVGVAKENVYTEEFVSPLASTQTQLSASSQLNNAEPHAGLEFPVNFKKTGRTVVGDSTRSLLEIAEDNNIEIPWECRSGICGQCKLRCNSGSTAMPSADALTTSERQAGWILACQAKPASAIEVDA